MDLRTGVCSMCLIGLFAAASFGQASVSFNAPKLFPAEGESLVLGDFNGDGNLDVAVANPHSSVSVLFGTGHGTFQPPVSYTIPGTTENAFVTGDFNGDGMLDLAIACAQCAPGSGIAVLLNRGGGAFQTASVSPLGETNVGSTMTVADFNGDGKLDLAIVDIAGNVLLALGNGNGTFQAATSIWPNAYALNIAAADLNADGHADLVVTSGQTFTPLQPGQVSILLGAGNGSFAAPVSYSVESGPAGSPYGLAIADFNGDGALDLAVANFTNNNVSILLGNGHGMFAAAVDYPANLGPSAIAAGDFDGDGKVDLAVGNLTGANISILKGLGNGTFEGGAGYPAPGIGSPTSLLAGDFNHDGKVDLACTGVTILLNTGHRFKDVATYSAGTNPSAIVVADFNNDGIPDVAVTDYPTNLVSVLLGANDGPKLLPAGKAGVGTKPSALVAGDFNGDGKQDLAVATQDGIYLLMGKGNGAFNGTGKPYSTALLGPLVAADFNGDGKLDLAGIDALNHVVILLGNGDGTFQAPIKSVAGPHPSALAVADFNGDGNVDLAAIVNPAGGAPAVAVLFGTGTGSFQAPVDYPAGPAPLSLAVGRLGTQALPGIVTASPDPTTSTGTVTIIPNLGNGTFGGPKSYAFDFLTTAVAIGNFDDGGYSDIAVAGSAFTVLVGDVTNAYQYYSSPTYAVGACTAESQGPGTIGIGAFDTGGKLDVATCYGEASVTVVLNSSN
jgi:hypothetical protein